jgi:hypothetical protein
MRISPFLNRGPDGAWRAFARYELLPQPSG